MKTLILFFTYLSVVPVVIAQTGDKPNILFVVVDDMNDWVEGFDGHPQTRTPVMSGLADMGTLFYNAYASAPQCGPSRTSFMTGKDPHYSGVYDNTKLKCASLSSNYTEEEGNETYYTLPGILKDSGGYYTYNIGKVFHCWKDYIDFDSDTPDPCARALSWNDYYFYDDDGAADSLFIDLFFDGLGPFDWGRVDSIYEPLTADYIQADSAISFINRVGSGSGTCDRPFFLALGIKKPHFPLYIPQQYFMNEFYMDDVYEEPFHIAFNFPEGTTPYNGIVLPDQTSPSRYLDYFALPEDGMARTICDKQEKNFEEYTLYLSPLPVVSDTLTDSLNRLFLEQSKRANFLNAYLAGIHFADAMLGRVMEALEAYPEMYNNTIVVVFGDHGFSLSEKRHWQKSTLWETDVRTSLLIADLRDPEPAVSYRMAGFVDLMPTLLDLAGVDLPYFPDGNLYPDGRSLTPFMHDGFKKTDRPVLSTIANANGKPASCYPHHSVRNNRFHFIHYMVQSGTNVMDCDSVPGALEEELYDIGYEKETDPNEWNNLAYDPNYAPVITFLKQWIPGHPMYLQEAYYLELTPDDSAVCLYDNDTNISFSCQVYDSLGTLTDPGTLAHHVLEWTNNYDETVQYGSSYMLNAGSIPDAVMLDENAVYLYAQLRDTTNQNITGFQLYTIHLHSEDAPTMTFSHAVDDHTVSISGYSLTGSAIDPVWNFGDGTVLHIALPGAHTYSEDGYYQLTHTLRYGNDCMLIQTDTVIIGDTIPEDTLITDTTLLILDLMENQFEVNPNPASSSIQVSWPQPSGPGTFMIGNSSGVLISKRSYPEGMPESTIWHLEQLPAGLYFIIWQTEQHTDLRRIAVTH